MTKPFPTFARTTWIHISMTGLALAWIIALFHWLGNTSDTSTFGSSLFFWTMSRWNDSTFYAADFSHAWLIPLVSLYASWQKRHALQNAETRTFWWGLALIALALLLHLLGIRAQQPRISLAALILLLWSSTLFLYGPQVARLLGFSFAFLAFCIPLNFLDSLSFPLRMLASTTSTALLNGIGIAVEQTGTAIRSASGNFSLEVADPCSGIKSLLAITSLTTAYAYFTLSGWGKRILLILFSLPIAVAANIIRIISLGIIGAAFHNRTYLDIAHEYSGFVVFAAAVLLMILMQELFHRLTQHPRNKISSPRTPS